MERKLEQYYTEFEQPPEAPTYSPTEEEFSDPISYVAKIRPEAEKFGLVKIIPPKSFRPPFCIDPTNFEFTPRVQRLNEIDALFRLRIIFINKLVKYWQIQGQQFRIPYTENKYIDLYRLRELVAEEGGHKEVTKTRKWSQIAKTLGFKPSAGPSMKYHYNKWIYPFVLSVSNSDNHAPDEEQNKPSTSAERKEEKTTPQTRSQSRMMAGSGKQKIKPIPSLDKSSIQGHRTPIELVVCLMCGSGDDEAKLLLCETCDNSMHIYCANPPMTAVPKGEWRCKKCVANELKSVSTDFGFVDSNQTFNLNTFGEWANNYKQQYFKQAPCDVPSERVEREFWRNVIDIDKAVQVKYGADLISSKVGSGFPRKEDTFSGVDAKERQLYANHPWNLNNLPKLRESVLCHMNMDISGMMVPWVYVGMLFSTFCWHVEDHWTYSINYNHWGERKIWYGIPGDEAEDFDVVMRDSAPDLFNEQADLLHHMTTALNPRYLMDRGVHVYTVHQNAGEFVITFPRAYHAGYNEGLNFAEAVNFAPPDWLRMGRQCLENYALVRRNCVFSHEELVMKMVSVSTKMSIGMCLATLEELSWIVAKETEFRKKLMQKGLCESQFCRFEDLPDDDRACVVCRTTLFCSGIVCKHPGRIVCMQHANHLCNECKIGDYCLKFRYTLEDLVPMVKRLSERTTAFFEWKKSVTELYSVVKEVEDAQKCANGQIPNTSTAATKKIDVRKMRLLADQWKNARFPHCEEIHRITRILAEFERTTVGINKIVNRKIRLRGQTRCQKADNRPEYSEVLHLRQQLKQSMFEEKELENGLKEICDKADDWKRRVQKAMSDEFAGVQSVDTLYQLVYEAEEEFNIRLESEGLEQVKMELTRCQWLVKAQKIMDQINHLNGQQLNKTEPEKDIDVKEHGEGPSSSPKEHRFELHRIGKLIMEATRWATTCELVNSLAQQLEAMFNRGTASDNKAEQFLANARGIGVEKAEACWQKDLSASNWVQSEAMDTFRTELEAARQIHADFTSFTEGCFTLKGLEQLDQQCSNSLFERGGRRHSRIRELRNSMSIFVERIRTIFQKNVNYYNLFDTIAGRSDLPALVEGDPIPLSLFTSSKYSDNWKQLQLFESKDQMLAHLNAITEQQSTLMHALRLVNEERPLKETCSCAQDECLPTKSDGHGNNTNPSASTSQGQTQSETINCFICNATFHGNCAQWDAFFERLPPGIFLCPRCLRSRRPCIEDVESACNSSVPNNSLEKIIVLNLIQRATDTFHKLQRLLHAIPKGTNLATISESAKLALKQWLTMALSLEVVDTEVYRMLTNSAYFELFPIPDHHVAIWRKIRERTVNAEPLPVIFSFTIPSAATGQSHSGRRVSGTKRRHGGHITQKNRRKSMEKSNNKNEADQTSDEECAPNKEEGEVEDGARPKKRSTEQIEKCAADFCLKPYSEYTRWIQCEAGCARWYHFCCVGISVRGAQLISSYCCYKCSSAQA